MKPRPDHSPEPTVVGACGSHHESGMAQLSTFGDFDIL
jgi:hypothetical protein